MYLHLYSLQLKMGIQRKRKNIVAGRSTVVGICKKVEHSKDKRRIFSMLNGAQNREGV
jgi:hypothetical protein